MQCIAFGVYEGYAWVWSEDAKQDVLYARKRFGTGGTYPVSGRVRVLQYPLSTCRGYHFQ